MTRAIVLKGRKVGYTAALAAAECERCRDDEPCRCGPERCRCTCGRCQYPGPLPGDGPAAVPEVLPAGIPVELLGYATRAPWCEAFLFGPLDRKPPIDDQRGRRG